MLNFLIRKAYVICTKNEAIPNSKKKLWQKLYYNGLKFIFIVLIEFFIKIKYKFKKNPINPLFDDGIKPIVSLTTFPARINSLWIVMDSIFNQTYPPAKVILVLTKEEFSNEMGDLPISIKQFINKGLEIVFTKDNLRPHNKYFYPFINYRHRGVITLDDDLYYWPDTIDRLLKLSKKHPDCVCANSVQLLSFMDDKLERINNFEAEIKYSNNLALGFTGVYYPESFRNNELFNIDNIVKLSLNADDLWLKAHELLSNIDVVGGDRYTIPLFVLGSQKFALRFKNADENENEIQWRKLDNHYNLSKYLNK